MDVQPYRTVNLDRDVLTTRDGRARSGSRDTDALRKASGDK